MNQLPNLIVFMMLAFLSLILLMNMPDSAPDWMAIVVLILGILSAIGCGVLLIVIAKDKE